MGNSIYYREKIINPVFIPMDATEIALCKRLQQLTGWSPEKAADLIRALAPNLSVYATYQLRRFCHTMVNFVDSTDGALTDEQLGQLMRELAAMHKEGDELPQSEVPELPQEIVQASKPKRRELNTETVARIKEALRLGQSVISVADAFDTTYSIVYMIAKGKTWRYV